VIGSCEHSNKPLDSVKAETLYKLNKHPLVQEDPAPWSYLHTKELAKRIGSHLNFHSSKSINQN